EDGIVPNALDQQLIELAHLTRPTVRRSNAEKRRGLPAGRRSLARRQMISWPIVVRIAGSRLDHQEVSDQENGQCVRCPNYMMPSGASFVTPLKGQRWVAAPIRFSRATCGGFRCSSPQAPVH